MDPRSVSSCEMRDSTVFQSESFMEGLIESDEEGLIGSDREYLVAETTSRFPIGDYNGPIKGIFVNVGTAPCSLTKDLIDTIEGSFKEVPSKNPQEQVLQN
jgi:hypothetical protein